MNCSRPPPRAGTRTQATTVSLCTSSPPHRSISVSILLPSAVRRSLSSRSLRCVLVATVLSPPRLPRLTHRRAHWRQGASTSPDGGGNFHQLRVGRKGPWTLIGAPTAPPLPCCAVTDRGSARGLGRRDAPRPQPAQVQAAQARSHSSRTFVTPRNMKQRRAIACLLAPCRRITCGTRAGPNSAAGRRGRRRSAYEAPRAAADGGTRLGGAESKRRRRPRLPAPPFRVALLERTRARSPCSPGAGLLASDRHGASAGRCGRRPRGRRL